MIRGTPTSGSPHIYDIQRIQYEKAEKSHTFIFSYSNLQFQMPAYHERNRKEKHKFKGRNKNQGVIWSLPQEILGSIMDRLEGHPMSGWWLVAANPSKEH